MDEKASGKLSSSHFHIDEPGEWHCQLPHALVLAFVWFNESFMQSFGDKFVQK